MRILAINGSPRKNGNSSILLNELLRGAKEGGASYNRIDSSKLNLEFCRGCLKCNLVKRCVIKGDDWSNLSNKILKADSLIIASPVYFRSVTASVKKIIDRFRSFFGVQIKEKALNHSPWQKWNKHLVLILSQGSPDPNESQSIERMFKFIIEVLGQQNRLTTIVGTRLAVKNQILMSKNELAELYKKLGLPDFLIESDYLYNQELLKKCYKLGRELTS